MNYQSLLRIALLAPFLLLFAACGGGNESNTSGSGDNNSDNAAGQKNSATNASQNTAGVSNSSSSNGNADNQTIEIVEDEEGGWMKMATIEGADAVREFQRNLRIVQAQRDRIVTLRDEIENSDDPEKEEELQTEIDKLATSLRENNKLMAENYGFTIQRNYQIIPERSRIFMAVTPEELKELKEQNENSGKSDSK